MSILLDGDNGETLPGNLTFTGTGNRIRADFSNTTLSNRAMFQTTTVNGATSVSIIPNGTATISNSNWFTSSDPNNSSYGQIAVVAGTEVRFFSSAVGTGSVLPMTFWNNNLERMRIEPDAAARIKTTGPVYNDRVTQNTGTIDLSLSNNFTVTPAAPITLTFNNTKDGQSGIIILANTSGYAISRTNVYCDANFLTTVSSAGVYVIAYFSLNGSVRLTYSQNTQT